MEPDTTFQLFGRFDGPLNLRLILQPCIAAIFGYLDGTKDAKAGAPPYFWKVTNVSQQERQALIKHGWASIGKVTIKCDPWSIKFILPHHRCYAQAQVCY
ncbi:MAG: hypothetical protein KAI80_09695 [Hyphomicrobiaceae bacterium]|nr:hypothetical protein [Hyphomicrobiaceae bacterium]